MNSSINRNKTKILCISNCSNNAYTLISTLAKLRRESFNQICCSILFNFKDTPYLFADSNDLLSFKSLLTKMFTLLDKIALIEHKEAHILSLAYKETGNKNFLINRNQIIKDNQQVTKKTNVQYKTILQLWNTFGLRHASAENLHGIKKHLLKISNNSPITFIHPTKPFHTFGIYIPKRLYTLIKTVCSKQHISFHTLFALALIHQHIIPEVVPTTTIINALPTHKSAFQQKLVNNYIFYQSIIKNLHGIEREDLSLYKQYDKQYKSFLLIIKNIFYNN